jgi:hypothetical protein
MRSRRPLPLPIACPRSPWRTSAFRSTHPYRIELFDPCSLRLSAALSNPRPNWHRITHDLAGFSQPYQNGRGSAASEKRAGERRKTARNGPAGHRTWFGWTAGKAQIPRGTGRCRASEKECPDWRDWRRERNCRRTLSGPFSMTYEPHKAGWMLTGESRGC